MLGLQAFVALATLVTPSLAQPKLSRTPYADRTVPGKLLVELAAGSTIGARDGEVVDIHARFFEELDRRLPANSVRRSKTYNSDVFRGVSLDITNADDIKVIAQTKGVKRVEPVYIVRQPKVTKAPAPEVKAAPNQYPPHIQTGVDKLHALGITGKGVTVGIIDSGVDYLHPALGGGFGPGFKVVGGYDFVGDDGLSPDDDPYNDGCNEHGTHVSGIVAANPNNPYNVTGVAYDASLRHYRVFGCGGETSTEIIANAMVQAYEDGVDVINMSLGGPDGWVSDITSDIGSRIARAGTVMAISAGNDGQYGAWYTSGPASGLDVVAISSIDNIALAPLWTISTTLPNSTPIPYQWDGSLNPLPVGADVALPVYFTSTDPTVVDDACNALPASTPDLSGFVTVVRRGTCNFTVKIQNVVSKGGKVILIYNNGNTFGPITTGGYEFAALIQDSDGLALLSAFTAGTDFTVSFPTSSESIVNLPNSATGGLVSDYSSFGATFNMYFKPAVGGVGGGILNTLPLSLGGYGVLSGTSMAAPQFAGISALLIQAKGKGVAKNPTAFRSLLQTTSTKVPASRDEGAATETLAQAGAGLANAYNALTYKTVLTPGELLLNDTAFWKPSHTIYIKNTDKKPKTYTIKHVPARTILTFAEPGSVQVAEYPVPDTTAAVSVRFSLTKATVLPGLTLPILVSITAPTNAPASQVPIYSGHIEVATAGETLHTSYLGAGQALKKVPILDTTDEALGVAFPLLLDSAGGIQEGPADYTLQGDDYPVALYRMSFGSPYYSFDLVPANFTLPATKSKRSFLGDWLEGVIGNWFPSRPTRGGSYAKVATLGRIFEYSYDIRNENYDYPYWSVAVASYANGTAIAPGSYKILARFLRVTGNAKLQEDYESWVSEQINVVAA